MENNEICWESEVGKLSYDFKSRTWRFKTAIAEISLVSWRCTKKGPLTELYLTTEKREVIIEVLEKKFNTELYEPENLDETHEKVLSMCTTLLNNVDYSSSYLYSELISCVTHLSEQFTTPTTFHVYFGNGLFFGLYKYKFGKISRIRNIPPRCPNY